MKKLSKILILPFLVLSVVSCGVVINPDTSTGEGTGETEKVKLKNPRIKLKNNVVTWEPILNAKEYEIYVNDEAPIKTTRIEYSLNNKVNKKYNVKIKAIPHNNTNYKESDFSNELRFDSYVEVKNDINILSRIGMKTEILGEVERNLPDISDGGLDVYPKYYVNLPNTDNNQAIEEENISLIASSQTYDKLDSEGNLYLGSTKLNKKLYKHSASVGLYGGDVDDSEKAISKKITISDPRLIGNYITGLYAPAGEVIKIEISEADLAKTKDVTVIIGQSAGRNQANDIEAVKTFNRMPRLQNKMTVNEPTAYVGSYLGGPIYISTANAQPFSITITGAVEYLHYIDGYTSEEEFDRLYNTTAPYLDFEVYDKAFRISGPRYTTYSEETDLDFKNLENTMKLWQNINLYSRELPHGMNSNAFITMLFDTYIKAGAAALAIVGADYATLPVGWMKGMLDYNSFMTIGGWGVIHEFNHHFQKFGCNGNNNEVTNNVLNFMEYILFTRITEYRDYNNISHGLGLDPYEGIKYYNQYRNYINPETNELINLNTEKGYGMLVVNFGPDLMQDVFINQNGLTTVDAFYKALTETIKLDFEFFFKELWHLNPSEELVQEMKQYNYKTYVPIGSYYASSFSYLDINNESKHALPYLCDNGLIIDLDKDIITLDDFEIEILNMHDYGNKMKHIKDNIYQFITDTNNKYQFDVEVKIKKDDFEQLVDIKYELNPNNQGISIKTYEYDNLEYTNIKQALENDLEGYNSIKTKYQDRQLVNGIKKNTIVEAEGKFIINETGDYQVCYKGGKGSSVFYASINNMDNYEIIGEIDINQSGYMLNAKANKLLSLNKNDVIYYKIYLLPTSDNASFDIGLALPNNLTKVVKYDDKYFRSNYGSFNSDTTNYNLRNDLRYLPNYKNEYDSSTITISSPNFEPWNNTFGLDKIMDGNSTTYAHSKQGVSISEANPIDLYINSDEAFSFNRMNLYGRTNGFPCNVPISFDLYIKENEEYKLYKSYKDIELKQYEIKVSLEFDEIITTTSVYLHITKTAGGTYFAMSNLEIYTNFESLYLNEIKYYGNVLVNYEVAPYGFVYILNDYSYLECEFDDSICLALSSDKALAYINGIEADYNLLFEKELYSVYEFKMKGHHKLKIKVDGNPIKVYDILKVIE